MESREVDKLIDAIASGEISYENVFATVRRAWDMYFMGTPIMRDDDYDALVREILDNPYYAPMMQEMTGTEPVDEKSGHKILQHRFPQLRGTLNNVHKIRKADESSSKTHKSMEEWTSTLPRRVKLHCSLKVDGISGVIELEPDKSYNVLKRGDTSRNKAQTIPILEDFYQESLYNTFMGMYDRILESNEAYFQPYPDEHYPIALKAEVYMTKDKFYEIEEELDVDNHLSAVSSLVNKLNPNKEHVGYLSIYPISCVYQDKVFNMLAHRDVHDVDVTDLSWWNPQNNLFVYSDDFEGMKKVIRIYRAISEKYHIPADGVVFAAVEEDVRESVGRDKNINNYEIAYKFPLEIVEARIRDIEMSVGAYGSITPVAKIDPVRTGGVSVKSITIGSADRYKELNLGKGDIVGISRGVVPYLHNVVQYMHKEPIPLPESCPTCNKLLDVSETGELTCRNFNCASRLIGAIESHCKRMDIAGISDKTIEVLINKGFLTDILSLYFLEQYQYRMKLLPKFGEASVAKLLNAIKEATKKPIKDYVLFGALGIATIGESKFKKILNHVTPNDLIFRHTEIPRLLTGIEGIGESTIDIVNRWFSHKENRNLAHGLTLVYHNMQSRNPFENTKSYVFTGFRDKGLTQMIEENGHEYYKSYKKDVTYVVVPKEGHESPTVDKALKNGNKIITREQLQSVLV